MPVTRRTASETEPSLAIPRWFLSDINSSRQRAPSLLSHLRAFYQQLDRGAANADDDPCPAPELEGEGEEIEPTDDAEPMSPDYSDEDDEQPAPSASQDASHTTAQACDPPGPCSFLAPGQAFAGTQCLYQDGVKTEEWNVSVRIQGYDPAAGYVCGVMEAHAPQSRTPVVTFWEGELVDNMNHCFYTRSWETDRASDEKFWSKFGGFTELKQQVQRQSGHCSSLASSPYVFMRWKERCFVNVDSDCDLSIAGFYYVCISRRRGSVQGHYYDVKSEPHQELNLQPVMQGECGHAFGSYKLR